jgi:hypothetical protein
MGRKIIFDELLNTMHRHALFAFFHLFDGFNGLHWRACFDRLNHQPDNQAWTLLGNRKNPKPRFVSRRYL